MSRVNASVSGNMIVCPSLPKFGASTREGKESKLQVVVK